MSYLTLLIILITTNFSQLIIRYQIPLKTGGMENVWINISKNIFKNQNTLNSYHSCTRLPSLIFLDKFPQTFFFSTRISTRVPVSVTRENQQKRLINSNNEPKLASSDSGKSWIERSADLKQRIIQQVSKKFALFLPFSERTFLLGLLFGDIQLLDAEQKRFVVTANAQSLFSLSPYTLLLGIEVMAEVFMRRVPRKLVLTCMLPILLLQWFVFSTKVGFFRSYLTLLLRFGAQYVWRRPYHSFYGLAVVVGLLVISYPPILTVFGFWWSTAAAAGIQLVFWFARPSPHTTPIPKLRGGRRNWLTEFTEFFKSQAKLSIGLSLLTTPLLFFINKEATFSNYFITFLVWWITPFVYISAIITLIFTILPHLPFLNIMAPLLWIEVKYIKVLLEFIQKMPLSHLRFSFSLVGAVVWWGMVVMMVFLKKLHSHQDYRNSIWQKRVFLR